MFEFQKQTRILRLIPSLPARDLSGPSGLGLLCLDVTPGRCVEPIILLACCDVTPRKSIFRPPWPSGGRPIRILELRISFVIWHSAIRHSPRYTLIVHTCDVASP